MKPRSRLLVALLSVSLSALSSGALLSGCASLPAGASDSAVAARGLGGLPGATPESVGMSSERLARVKAWLQGEIDAGRIPGAVLVVSRYGKVVFNESLGRQRPDAATPMSADALFRIYSMTKPIVSVAAMMLVEEGRLQLEAPVARYLPEMAKLDVATDKRGADGKTMVERAPAARPMTVQDLLRHTSGLTYGFFGEGAAKRAYVEAGFGTSGDQTNAEFVTSLAKLPLAYHPGTTWDYSVSTDVLGRLIEVVSGQTLFAFLKQRLLDPLGMRDTMFYLTEPARAARLAEPLASDRTIGVNATVGDPTRAQKMESGGGGMLGSAPDYLRFAQMMLEGGALDGRRYLSPQTVRYMTSDHLGSAIARTPLYLPGPGYGFGLGYAVRTSTGVAASPGNVGEYYWGGAGGTYFWSDPRARMNVVFMMQSPRQRAVYRPILRNMIYASILR